MLVAIAIGLAASTTSTDTLAVFRGVCIEAESHSSVLERAAATAWRPLSESAVPALLKGNGMVRLQDVRQGEVSGRTILLAIGELGGSSFCRVYFEPVDTAAMAARLEAEAVFEQPLGRPDFDERIAYPEGWKAIGWHRSTGSDWRAVHYSFDPDGKSGERTWQQLEITRPL